MKYRTLIIFIPICFVFAACEERDIPDAGQSEMLMLFSAADISTADANADADNLPEEYNIFNLSIFLTDPGSEAITEQFVHQPFTSMSNGSVVNCKSVKLPLDPAMLTRKDIYVIANCRDVSALNAIQTVNDIKALKTPLATAVSGLSATGGLPMYGESLNVNLNQSTTDNPTSIMLSRTCAKLRITIKFPNVGWVGVNNQFIVENAASYTYYKYISENLPNPDLLNYPRTNFTTAGSYQYTAVAYVYESATAPRVKLYTTINGTERMYTVASNFPIPARNYLYDIDIQIYKPGYVNPELKIKITEYNKSYDTNFKNKRS